MRRLQQPIAAVSARQVSIKLEKVRQVSLPVLPKSVGRRELPFMGRREMSRAPVRPLAATGNPISAVSLTTAATSPHFEQIRKLDCVTLHKTANRDGRNR